MARRSMILLFTLILLIGTATATVEWEHNTGTGITASAISEAGDYVYIGTDAGTVYCYDVAGSSVWDASVVTSHGTVAISDMSLSGDGTHLLLSTGAAGKRVEVRDGLTGALFWYNQSSHSPAGISISHIGDRVAVTYPETNETVLWNVSTNTSITTYVDDSPTHIVTHPSGGWVAYSHSGNTITLRTPRENVPGFPAYGTTYSGVTSIAYTGDGVQLVYIHRSAGTDYSESTTTGTRWHIYIGENGCKSDYGDIRFVDGTGTDVSHYLTPGYTSSVGVFEVLLPVSSQVHIWYGNADATTAGVMSSSLSTTTFTTNGTYTAPTGISQAEVLVVAGGGGGGLYNDEDIAPGGGGGGGGAGGLINTVVPVSSPRAVTVGIGGAATYPGTNSSFGDLVAIGGGAGGYGGQGSMSASSGGDGHPGGTGGSGGGGGGGGTRYLEPGAGGAGGIGTVGQGHDGLPGVSAGSTYGGAGGAGGGLAYASSISGNTVTYSRGGAGGGAGGAGVMGWGGAGGGAATDGDPDGTGADGIVIVKPLSAFGAMTSVETRIARQTATYTGTISAITRDTTGSWIGVQTDNRLYLQRITNAGAFDDLIDLGVRIGTPYDLAITDGGLVAAEGRVNVLNIYNNVGVLIGTYTAGNSVRHVAMSPVNGLYAAAGSDDGKCYLFSKDETSAWYQTYASESGAPITALSMSWRGEGVIVGDSAGHIIYHSQREEADIDGMVTLTFFQRGHALTNTAITVESGGTSHEWTGITPYITDSYGRVVIPVMWGETYRVSVGDSYHIITATASTPEHVIVVPADEPLRTGAQYRSWYDDVENRVYYSFKDTRGKTSRAYFQIYRSSDNAFVYAHDIYVGHGNTDIHTGYYQIPEGYENTSYKVRLTVTGSPSFTNTWHQWVSGKSGVASLPVQLSKTLKIGIFMVLLLFVGGIFSYFSGPHGAVVVSLMAAMLVFWGWLPISPAVVVLGVVWAFLGLLGRTSVG